MSDTPPALNEIGDDADAAIGDERAKSTSTGAPLNDDLFFSTISDPEQHQRPDKEIKLDDDDDEEDSRRNQPTSSASASQINIQPPVLKSFNMLLSDDKSLDNEPNDEDESGDKFIEISVDQPSKVGDGMSSYMVYKITTKTNYPVFKSGEFSSTHRFSDFLTLHEKLKEKHLRAGRILPPAPEKDMIGTAKVKMSSKEDTSPVDFIEKRRAALQRFLTRLASHRTFRYDPDFRDFVELGDEVRKSTNASALSGAGVLKMFKSVTDSVNKVVIKMDETDQWFEEKFRQVDNLLVQYRKLHGIIDMLYTWRKDLATSTKDFSKSASILANAEEQLVLSRYLSQLGEIYEKIDQIYLDQSNSDYFTFAELVKDYIALFENIKEVFYQRIKTYSNWQRTVELLKAKNDARIKLETSNKLDKVPALAAEIRDLEVKVERTKEEFEQISKTIKEEMRRFDLVRYKEFKSELTKYVQGLLKKQELIVKTWEQYLTQLKEI